MSKILKTILVSAAVLAVAGCITATVTQSPARHPAGTATALSTAGWMASGSDRTSTRSTQQPRGANDMNRTHGAEIEG
jgi:hypothetical protein